ncbi:tetratricopeptide repeat protein [Undibacterium seohonense]|uniref:Tetratricopeptide repeat protein n=1 Tax=Undibacterium seohonense TaxID=1344950 RepID=A0ABR6X3Z6_9BURK|nr:tetratricopeptide repeat protein [Undibacterium seohonense]MBC3807647.1 tetratricopeptide repeat protein [Undibacterium seohonense]
MSDPIQNLLQQAITHHQQGRLQLAEDTYAQVLQINPRQFDALHLIGVIAKQRGDHETALNFFAKAIQVDARQAKVHCNLGATLQELGKSEEALACYELAISLQADYAMAWNNRGNCLRHLGRFEEALESFTKAMELQIAYPEAYLNRAVCLQDMNQHEHALLDVEDALRSRRHYPAAQFARGFSLQQLRRYELALVAYELAFDTSSSPQQQAAVICNQGMILAKLKRDQEALATFQRAIEIRPDFGNAYLQLGHLYRSTNKQAEAVQAYQNASHYLTDTALQEQLRYLLASLGQEAMPSAAPITYVKELFDQYAEHFDTHLQEHLAYRIPELLQDAVQGLIVNKTLSSLDLGCGTGLCADYLRSISTSLIGVDVSENMLAKAAQRGDYSELVCDDIVHYLQREQRTFDLILAADVLVYFGDLGTVFDLVKRRLVQGGFFTFSVELSDTADIHLHSTQRYQHSRAYIDKMAQQFGFHVAHGEQHIGRHEAQIEVKSLIMVLRAI